MSERSAAWLAHLFWVQGVVSSNPTAPTTILFIMRATDFFRRYFVDEKSVNTSLVKHFIIFQLISLSYNIFTVKEVAGKLDFSLQDILMFINILLLMLLINVVISVFFYHAKTRNFFIYSSWLISAWCTYYIKRYGIFVNKAMIANLIHTTKNEFSEFVTLEVILYIFAFGFLPAYFFQKYFVPKQESYLRFLKKIGIFVVCVLIFSGFNSKVFIFLRQHHNTRVPLPANYIISLIDYTRNELRKNSPFEKRINISENSKILTATKKPNIFVLIVGESARWDRFSLNGYQKETNPLLSKQQNIINFTQTHSCNTFTRGSLPCMFSHMPQKTFLKTKQKYNGLLNIIDAVGYQILHLSNSGIGNLYGALEGVNRTSVMTRNLKDERFCEYEDCFDEIMVHGGYIDKFISEKNGQNIFIVLHQLGSHGPAYYKRYPRKFAKFQPECTKINLSDCNKEDLSNAYNNTILYTDYIISSTIDKIKKYNNDYNVGLFYVSDHGQSLGEKHMYLHSAPIFIAPEAQTHVPMMIYLSDDFIQQHNIDIKTMHQKTHQYTSHDNMFHTILGLLNIENSYYQKDLDLSK